MVSKNFGQLTEPFTKFLSSGFKPWYTVIDIVLPAIYYILGLKTVVQDEKEKIQIRKRNLNGERRKRNKNIIYHESKHNAKRVI